MLKENLRSLAPWLVASLLVAILIWTPTFALNDPHNQQTDPYQSEEEGQTTGYVAVVGAWLEDNDGAITAVSTIIIALFTITLYIATSGLLQAARDDGVLTRESIDDARESSERQLRAYVDIDQIFFDQNPSNKESGWFILVILKNFGSTPALELSVKVETSLGLRDEAEEFPFTDNAHTHPKSRIPPGHHATATAPPRIPPGLSGFNTVARSGEFAYAWGEVEYADAFGRRWWFRFQHVCRFRNNSGSFAQCEGGNIPEQQKHE